MGFNTKYILPSDNREEIVGKINYNFYQLFFNAVGGIGPSGVVGPTGQIGQVGEEGNVGSTGNPATNWIFQSFEPSSGISGDFWVNTGSTGGRDIYFYNGNSWTNTGETLLNDNVFSLLTSIQGPGSSLDHNAVTISYTVPQTPGNYNLVLSDIVGASGDINPNLSKLLISNDASQFIRPLISFSKDFFISDEIPSYKWKNVGVDYDFEFSTPDNLSYISGATSEYSTTGGTATLSSANNITISGSTVSITGATGLSGAFSFNTPTSINIFSGRTEITPSSFSLLNFTQGSTSSHSSSNSINLQSPFGMSTEINSTSDSNVIFASTNVAGSTGEYYFSAQGSGRSVVGNVGLTGSAGVRVNLVKPFTLLTYSVGPTFSNPPYTNSFADVPISNLYEDIVRIRVRTIGSTFVSADGKSNRFYLQFSNFSQLLTTVGEVRTFDFLLDDLTYAFGGIRVFTPSVNNIVPIPDGGLGATQACRHIRITFMPSRNGFFYNSYSTGNNSCGFISYVAQGSQEVVVTE